MKKLDCILLVDDNVDDNFFHSLTIKQSDAAREIKTATTGDKALDYFEKCKDGENGYTTPDLIFLDINMPGMNGFEFLENLKNKKLINSGKQVVIIMLTSSLNPNDESLAKEKFSSEIKDFKNKPLTTEMLKEIIEKYF